MTKWKEELKQKGQGFQQTDDDEDDDDDDGGGGGGGGDAVHANAPQGFQFGSAQPGYQPGIAQAPRTANGPLRQPFIVAIDLRVPKLPSMG